MFTCICLTYRVNLPKEIMAFPDFEFDEALPSYPHRDDVMHYLAQYAATFDVMKYIKVW